MKTMKYALTAIFVLIGALLCTMIFSSLFINHNNLTIKIIFASETFGIIILGVGVIIGLILNDKL